ncbi:MAG TPA: holo-ACP synthase [Candidatus Nanopelagicaceae bacterium]|nr:holo-ACP synthase [Candidatus Nanopelagicaceae bacterium]
MIRGIGIDVVNIERFAESVSRTPGLLERLFTEQERLLPIASLAARFAAKEALAKALSVPSGLHWHDAEVMKSPDGAPYFRLQHSVERAVDGAVVHLSLSHDAGIASALVIVEAT